MRFLVAICLSLFVLSVTAPRVSAENEHGCATANSANPLPTVNPHSTPPTQAGALIINEVLFNPASQWNCSGNFDQLYNRWIEIYNPGNKAFILTTTTSDTPVITSIDSGSDTQPYHIPHGTTIAAHGFLILFPGDHPSFYRAELSMLRLLVAGVIVDEITLPQFGPDSSFARKPDGSDTWEIGSNATINASNASSLITPTPMPTPRPIRTPHITPTPQITPKVTPTPQITPKPTLSATPTIKITPIPKITPTPTSHTNTSTTPGISTTPQSQAIHTQPSWEELHKPDLTPIGKLSPHATSPPIKNLAPATLSHTGESGSMDLLRKIALSIVSTTLAGVLFWCWKLFDTR